MLELIPEKSPKHKNTTSVIIRCELSSLKHFVRYIQNASHFLSSSGPV